MNTINTIPHNDAAYKAYSNPHFIDQMTLADFQWLATVKPQWDDWISSGCYSKRQYFCEKLGDRYMELVGWNKNAKDAKEIAELIVTFLGYTPKKREPLPWH